MFALLGMGAQLAPAFQPLVHLDSFKTSRAWKIVSAVRTVSMHQTTHLQSASAAAWALLHLNADLSQERPACVLRGNTWWPKLDAKIV